MIEKYINKSYINNYSDIKKIKKDNEFIKLISKLKKDKYITDYKRFTMLFPV